MKKWLALLLFAAVCLFPAQAEETAAQRVTKNCKITSNRKTDLEKLTDHNLKSYWKAAAGTDYIDVSFPSGTAAGGLLIEWFEEPKHYTVEQFAADGTKLGEYESDSSFPAIVQYVPLDESAARARIHPRSGMRIAELNVYSAGTLPEDVQVWQKPVGKADIMLISTHQDDEELWFGGTIPYYDVQQDSDMIVVYMASCGRNRRGESLNGLWAMGVRTYPEFLNLKDHYADSYTEALKDWGGKTSIIGTMVNVIRKYKPEVIVTHDLQGEYGHPQHRVTAALIEDAVKAAADPEMYASSREEYGTWQVKKLYLHLSDTNTIYMDWNTPSDELGGLTPLQVSEIGFNAHESQKGNWNMGKGQQYDNSKFGLVYSTVGEDVLKTDFLENTVADLRFKAMPTASAEPTPVPTATPEPTAVPTAIPTAAPEPTATPAPAEPPSQSGSGAAIAAIAVIFGTAGACGALTYHSLKKKRARKRRKR